jgi:hypothetical protein
MNTFPLPTGEEAKEINTIRGQYKMIFDKINDGFQDAFKLNEGFREKESIFNYGIMKYVDQLMDFLLSGALSIILIVIIVATLLLYMGMHLIVYVIGFIMKVLLLPIAILLSLFGF